MIQNAINENAKSNLNECVESLQKSEESKKIKIQMEEEKNKEHNASIHPTKQLYSFHYKNLCQKVAESLISSLEFNINKKLSDIQNQITNHKDGVFEQINIISNSSDAINKNMKLYKNDHVFINRILKL